MISNINRNNSKNDMHAKTNEWIKSGTRYYFSIIELRRSYKLLGKPKTLVYHSYFRPVITYAFETWPKATLED